MIIMEDFDELVEIEADDQILDVENVHTEIRDHAILSTPISHSSSLSRSGDELDPFHELLENESGCLQFGEGLTDDESLDLYGYLSGVSLPLPFDAQKNHNVQTIELLKQHEAIISQRSEVQDVLKQVSNVPKVNETSNQQCMSKNAVAARENRLKKKQYISQLETAVKNLQEENESLRKSENEKDDELCKLKKEVKYLSNILKNETTLSLLLQNIHRTPGIQFADSSEERHQGFPGNKDECAQDIDSQTAVPKRKVECLKRKRDNPGRDSSESVSQSKRMTRFTSQDSQNEEENENSGGICLHVTGKKVSIEFCADCNNNSKSSLIYSDHSYVRQKMS